MTAIELLALDPISRERRIRAQAQIDSLVQQFGKDDVRRWLRQAIAAYGHSPRIRQRHVKESGVSGLKA